MVGVSVKGGGFAEAAKSITTGPPAATVVPSAESANELPNPRVPVPMILDPDRFHVAFARLNAHRAPAPLLSPGPPTRTILPSAEIATELPCRAWPDAPPPTSLEPCCVQVPFALTKVQAAPVA